MLNGEGVRKGLRGVVVSLVLGAGLIALMSVETPIEESANVRRKGLTQRNTWRRMYEAAVNVVPKSKSSALKEELKAALGSDEIAGGNPFENLSSEDALNEIFNHEISAFERKTLRSPAYRDESGYDLVHYEILHADGTLSSILAYVEHETEPQDEGAPEVKAEIPVVMVLSSKGERSQYTLYRAGNLEEVSSMMPEEGESLIGQRLESGIPFLSVSR